MTTPGFLRRLKSRRVALAGAAAGLVVLTTASLVGTNETVAAFVDDVWAGAPLTAGHFRLQSSLTSNGTFADNSTGAPLSMPGSTNPGTVGFATPIALAPGATSYAPVYLRLSAQTPVGATVKTAKAEKRTPDTTYLSDTNLWDTYVEYAARAVPASTSTTCNAAVWTNSYGTELYAPNSKLTSDATTATFPLAANASTTYMVCFRFTLLSGVTSVASANGKSVYPYWVFTGDQI